MRSSNSAKKLSLDSDCSLMSPYPADITSIFYMVGVRHSKSRTEIMWKMSLELDVLRTIRYTHRAHRISYPSGGRASHDKVYPQGTPYFNTLRVDVLRTIRYNVVQKLIWRYQK